MLEAVGQRAASTPPTVESLELPEPTDWVFAPREESPTADRPPAEDSPPTVAADTSVSSMSVVPLLLSAYFVVAGWLLLQLVWERIGVAWLLRDAVPYLGHSRVLVSGRVRAPVCFGVLRPTVVLPKTLVDAGGPPLRWALAHELDHLARGDTRTACWVGIARGLFFFVPWFWPLRRDLGLCQEYLADAAAAGDAPAAYAAFLVDLSAGRSSPRPVAVARMTAGRSDLYRRVHMLLNVKAVAGRAPRRFVTVAASAALAAAVGLSGLGFADEPKKDPAKPAELPRPRVLELVKPGGDFDSPVVPEVSNDLRKQYERQLKEFADKIKDAADAEAREQLEKARDEYKKAMEEPLKKADEASRLAEKARPRFDRLPAPFPIAPRGGQDLDDVLKLQAEMHKQLLQQLKGMGQLLGPDEKLLLQMLQGPDEKMLQQLLQGQGRDLLGPGGLFPPGFPAAANSPPPRLGVRVDKVPAVLLEQLDLPKDRGVVIADVTPDSPAEKAGLKRNDVLIRLGDQDVPTDPEAFIALVGKMKGGEKIDAVVLRKGKKETVKGIELPEAKPAADLPGGLRGGVRVGGGFGGSEQMQVQISNGEVSLQATVNGIGYTVAGTVEGGKVVPSKIVVKDGKESEEYESLEKVPEAHRATVERLLGRVRVR
jgi:hypothetical protein